MSTPSVTKYSKCCRICLKNPEITNNIFNIYFETLNYAKIIFECSGIEITEDQPNAAVLICTECEKSLLEAVLFRRKIIESNNVLNEPEIVMEGESSENEFEDDESDKDEPESNTKKKYYKHKSLHRNCNKCKIRFPDKKLYVSHVRQVHSSKVVCPICGKSLCNFSLTAHLKTHTTEKKFVCQICDKCLKSQTTLNTHMRTHTKEMRYKCEHCDEKFIHSSSRRKHTDQFHLDFKRYSCNLCTAKYFDHSALRSHITHHHTGEKKHKCETCGNFFMNVTVLKYHMRTHLTEKQFSCDTCGKSFANNSGLTRHLKTHTKTKDYPCTECKREFAQISCLKNHMKSHIVHVLPAKVDS